MVRRKDRKAIYIAGAILLVILVVIGVAALMGALNSNKDNTPNRTPAPVVEENTNDDATPDNKQEDIEPSTDIDESQDASNDPAPDPSSISTIDIESMGITVSFVKGVGGFEYLVLRTPSGTPYVEFSNSSLVGTKCTDDAGVFASIIENPATNESATLAKRVNVEGVEYGLSLAADTCTSDTELLGEYQKSFSDAFGLLKKSS